MVIAGNHSSSSRELHPPRKWEVEFARYIPRPPRRVGRWTPPAPPGLRHITRGKLRHRRGEWLPACLFSSFRRFSVCVLASEEMAADKVKGAGKEIGVTIERGDAMSWIKVGNKLGVVVMLPAKMHVMMEESAVLFTNLEIKRATSSMGTEQTAHSFGTETA
uniref:Uncharacterized protein n=1 Tax=Leersia perrieri TaxID=77586 RepID=A0A0D9WQ66_9ORYZ